MNLLVNVAQPANSVPNNLELLVNKLKTYRGLNLWGIEVQI